MSILDYFKGKNSDSKKELEILKSTDTTLNTKKGLLLNFNLSTHTGKADDYELKNDKHLTKLFLDNSLKKDNIRYLNRILKSIHMYIQKGDLDTAKYIIYRTNKYYTNKHDQDYIKNKLISNYINEKPFLDEIENPEEIDGSKITFDDLNKLTQEEFFDLIYKFGIMEKDIVAYIYEKQTGRSYEDFINEYRYKIYNNNNNNKDTNTNTNK